VFGLRIKLFSLIPPGALLLALIVGHPDLGHAATSSSGLADVVYPWGLLLLPCLLGLTIWVMGLRRRMTSAERTLDAEYRERQRSESELGTVLASMTSLVLELDNQGRVLRHIPTRYEFEHLDPQAFVGKPLSLILSPQSGERFHRYVESVVTERLSQEVEFDMALGGGVVSYLLTLSPLTESSVLLLARDITKRKRYEEELARQVFLDSMTGLPNRALFMDRLRRAMARARRRDGHQFAVLYINLDRFKIINESLGHSVGDAVINAMGRRIESCLRKVDTVSRFVGDEFVLLLDEVEDRPEALRVAERIRQTLTSPFSVANSEVYTTASMGIAYSAPHYVDPDEIVRDAHAAMQRARVKCKGGCKVFCGEMHENSSAFLRMETDMRKAIQRLPDPFVNGASGKGEFFLHYQPIVSMVQRRVLGVEALMRWNHPTMGIVPPGRFIPLAEETGLILPLGVWALQQACRCLSLLHAMPGGRGLHMSVNISAQQLQQVKLAETIRMALARSGLEPGLLHLELTESMVMDNPAEARGILKELKEIGVCLAIDDFGTGYSSLSHLYQFPFDILKIDRSFVSRMDNSDGKHCRIIEAIVVMAASLEMQVVAEGVETATQKTRLVELGCDLAQGFHFARPMDATTALTTMFDTPREEDARAAPAAMPGAWMMDTEA
jgi:diguanylate cyclase (GGDEF)-like protein